MKKIIISAAAAGPLALALAACGSGQPSTSSAAGGPGPSPAAASTAPASPLVTVNYKAQYLRIVTPANDAIDTLKSSTGVSQLQARANAVAQAFQTADDQLLRAQWPASVTPDIRAMVLADGPVIVDLRDLINTYESGTLQTALGSSTAAAQVVRADLGLPPAS